MEPENWDEHWSILKRDPLEYIDLPIEYSDISWRIYLKRLCQLVKVEKSKKILEIGCGSGIASRYLYRKGYDITAIDNSEFAVNILNNRISESYNKQIASCMNLYDLNEKNKYDLIISSGVKEFLPDLDQALRLEWLALKPGGVLYFVMVPRKFSVQTLGDLQRRLAYFFVKYLSKKDFNRAYEPAILKAYKINTYSEKYLIQTMEKIGFKDIAVRYRTPFPNIALNKFLKKNYINFLIHNENYWLRFGNQTSLLSKILGISVEVFARK